ncbi:hypothetical protein ACOMICROBIO_LMKGKHOH_04605 [Vibrio sp. B1FIG11]|jgi:hypothetical protein|nr:hypothetical protein A1Q_1771 [Vibrio campbellii HY01]CAD7820658.1 hypothetical protein ACOMICROBIO_LMKGKHOH_04605 [Vibrio sp. B1FIG11]CAE6941352.1 hypothetical protein ACOMICROBIO_LMKGKHOH_04605 [Vibrio sp. B1FIG11]
MITEKSQMGELIKSVVVSSLYFVGFLALLWVVTSHVF